MQKESEWVVFWVTLKNVGEENVKILDGTTLILLPVKGGAFVQHQFWIVGVGSEAGNLETYEDGSITLAPEEETVVLFGTKDGWCNAPLPS